MFEWELSRIRDDLNLLRDQVGTLRHIRLQELKAANRKECRREQELVVFIYLKIRELRKIMKQVGTVMEEMRKLEETYADFRSSEKSINELNLLIRQVDHITEQYIYWYQEKEINISGQYMKNLAKKPFDFTGIDEGRKELINTVGSVEKKILGQLEGWLGKISLALEAHKDTPEEEESRIRRLIARVKRMFSYFDNIKKINMRETGLLYSTGR